MEVKNQFEKNVKMFQNLVTSDGGLEAPICIAESLAKPLLLSELKWNNWQGSSKLKVTNTGHTAMVTGQWSKSEKPSICGGPFTEPYELAQIHFHWGRENSVGSEHMLNGQRYPLEMHVMLYRRSLKRPKIAFNDPRGSALLVYFFEVSKLRNESLETISEQTKTLRPFHTTTVDGDFLKVVMPFTDDYYLYWGSLKSKKCSHVVLWLVYPYQLKISPDQLENFRKMLGKNGSCIVKNYGSVKPLHNRNVFRVSSNLSRDITKESGTSALIPADNNVMVKMTHRSRFCCLSIRKVPQKFSIQTAVGSLNQLELQTYEKVRMLEELSRGIIRDSKEHNDWLKATENLLRKREVKEALKSKKGNITYEMFSQMKLRNVFFKTIKQNQLKAANQIETEESSKSNPTFFIRNTLFRDSSESEVGISGSQNKPINWETEVAHGLAVLFPEQRIGTLMGNSKNYQKMN